MSSRQGNRRDEGSSFDTYAGDLFFWRGSETGSVWVQKEKTKSSQGIPLWQSRWYWRATLKIKQRLDLFPDAILEAVTDIHACTFLGSLFSLPRWLHELFLSLPWQIHVRYQNLPSNHCIYRFCNPLKILLRALWMQAPKYLPFSNLPSFYLV